MTSQRIFSRFDFNVFREYLVPVLLSRSGREKEQGGREGGFFFIFIYVGDFVNLVLVNYYDIVRKAEGRNVL